jgi:hypothetical protein
MKHFKSPIIFLACAGILTGCSGGSSSNSVSSSGTSFAQFIDAPVKGVKVRRLSSGAEVTTDSEGRFECEPNEPLSFKVGGLELGQAACSSEVFVTDFGEGRWQKAAKVLQCLSETEPSSGLLDVSKVSADLSSINLESDDDNSIDSKLGSHRKRPVTKEEAEGHALGHLLDRIRYDAAFVALFASTSTLSESIIAERVEVEGTGADILCPKFYNVTLNFNKVTKSTPAGEKVFYSANLSKVVAYSADSSIPGDDCAAIGLSAPGCRDWVASEMSEKPTIHKDEFRIVRFKNSFSPESGIASGVKKLKIKGELEVSGGELSIEGEWKDEFNVTLSGGNTLIGSCKYEF